MQGDTDATPYGWGTFAQPFDRDRRRAPSTGRRHRWPTSSARIARAPARESRARRRRARRWRRSRSRTRVRRVGQSRSPTLARVALPPQPSSSRPRRARARGAVRPSIRRARSRTRPTALAGRGRPATWARSRSVGTSSSEDCGSVIQPHDRRGAGARRRGAQGIAAALYERLALRRRTAQPLSGTLRRPTWSRRPAGSTPSRSSTSRRPPAHSATGAKGMGEGGMIGAPAAVANAVSDALAPPRRRDRRHPHHAGAAARPRSAATRDRHGGETRHDRTTARASRRSRVNGTEPTVEVEPCTRAGATCCATTWVPGRTSGASTASADRARCCWTASRSVRVSVFGVQADAARRPDGGGSGRPGAPVAAAGDLLVEPRAPMRVLHAGFLMLATAFLRDHPSPSDEEIREAMASNLCRCTGYQNILRAVRLAARRGRRPVDGAVTAPGGRSGSRTPRLLRRSRPFRRRRRSARISSGSGWSLAASPRAILRG